MPNKPIPVHADSIPPSSCLKRCRDALSDLETSGLFPLALARLTSQEQSLLQTTNCFVCIIGNVGSSIWPFFSQSTEFRHSVADPLDTWSKRLLRDAFADLTDCRPTVHEGCNLVFPSDGPPYAPFQKWAFRSGLYYMSPISIGLHQRYGLWTAFRGAVLLNEDQALAFKELMTTGDIEPVSPCISCDQKPCLTACPVKAFTVEAESQTQSVSLEPKRLYNVDVCRQLVLEQSVHTESESVVRDRSCFDAGCLARRACPVGRHLVYDHQQVRFHMKRLITPKQIAAKTP